MLIRPPHYQSQDNCEELTVLFLHVVPFPTCRSSCPLIVSWGSGVEIDRSLPSPTPVARLQNKAIFPFYATCLFIGLWVASSQTSLLVNSSTQDKTKYLKVSVPLEFPSVFFDYIYNYYWIFTKLWYQRISDLGSKIQLWCDTVWFWVKPRR